MADVSKTMEIIVRLRDRITNELSRVTREIKVIPTVTKAASRGVDILNLSFTTLRTGISKITSHVFSLQGLLLGLGIGATASNFLDVAASFEDMEIKLNALTKGKGVETLNKINEWALKMPVNTRKAVDTFSMMMAMGLDPTIEKMQTLVDVSVLFGEDAMPRVARALGQMITLGKLSSEELNQMSEAGINARKYITQAFNMTVEEAQKAKIPIKEIVDAIWKGLDADYAGSAVKAQRSWRGLWTTFISYIEEVQKRVMDAGLFDALKDVMVGINTQLEKWIKNNEDLLAQKVPEFVEKVTSAVSTVWEWLQKFYRLFQSLPDSIVGIAGMGLVGRILLGGPRGFLLSIGFVVYKFGEMLTMIGSIGTPVRKQLEEDRDRIMSTMRDMAGGAEGVAKALADPSNKFHKNMVELQKSLDTVNEKIEIWKKNEIAAAYAGTKAGRERIKVIKDQIEEKKKQIETWDLETKAMIKTYELSYGLSYKSKEEDLPGPIKSRIAELKRMKDDLSDLQGILKDIESLRGLDVALEDFYGEGVAGIAKKIEKDKKAITTVIKPISIDQILKWDAEDIKSASEKLLGELDRMYNKGIILASEYYKRKKDMLIDDTNAQIAIIEEMIEVEKKGREKTVKGETTVTVDLEKVRELYRQIEQLREGLNVKLIQLGEDEVQSEKNKNKEILDARTQLYDALKWKAEGYLEFRVEQLVKETAELAKHAENQELVLQYLEMRKKELLDEWLQNNNKGYSMLVDMSQRTAEAIEQTFSDYLFDLMQNKFDTWRDRLYNLFLGIQRIVSDVAGGIIKDLLVKGAKHLLSMGQEAATKANLINQIIAEKAATLALSAAQMVEVASVTALTTAYWLLAAAKSAAGVGGGGADALYGWGGVMQGFAGGGEVKGRSSHSKADNIPVLVTGRSGSDPGEFIHPIDSVKHYGLDIMEGIRQKIFPREIFNVGVRLPRTVSMPRYSYATGGQVNVPASKPSDVGSDESGQTIVIANIQDPRDLNKFLHSPEGTNAYLNWMSSNAQDIVRILTSKS